MNTFKFIGHIKPMKENTFVTKDCESGWRLNSLKFLMVCGTDSQFVELTYGKYPNDDKNKAFISVKNGDKYESKEIKWVDRLNPENIEAVPVYKRYIIDTDTKQHREEIEKGGNDTELSASKKKRTEYINSYDFGERLRAIVVEKAEAIKTWKFEVTGSVELARSNKDGRVYRKFVPQHVIRVPEDTEPVCEGTLDLFFNRNDVEVNENGDLDVKAYLQYYEKAFKDGPTKGKFFTEIPTVVKKETGKVEGYQKLFTKKTDAEVRQMGMKVYFKNGSDKQPITEATLTDEQKEMIELGIMTLEQISAANNGGVYGDRVTEVRLNIPSAKYTSGPEDTAFSVDDLTASPTDSVNKASVDEVIDAIDDDDDII